MSDLKNFSGEVVFLEGGGSHAALAELSADSPWMMATYPDLPNAASRVLGSQVCGGAWPQDFLFIVFLTCQALREFVRSVLISMAYTK